MGVRALAVLGICGALVLAGCGHVPSTPGDPASAAAGVSAWPSGSGGPGDGSGVWWPVASSVALRPTGVRVIRDADLAAVTVDAEGSVWLARRWSLTRVVPGAWTSQRWDVGDDEAFGGAFGLRAASAGSGVWLVRGGELRLFDGTRFARLLTVPADVRDGADGVIRDVLDLGSELWVATATGVARCADGVWSVVQPGELESVTQLAVDSAGAVWALGVHHGAEGTHLAVVRYDGTHWVIPDVDGSPRGGSQIVANPQGGVVVRLGRSAWQYDGTAWRRFTLPGTGGRIGSLGEPALAVTADGTVWMLGEEALVRLDRHGSWQPATSDAIGAWGLVAAGDSVLAVDGDELRELRDGTWRRAWSGEPVGPTVADLVVVDLENASDGPEPRALDAESAGTYAVTGDGVGVLRNVEGSWREVDVRPMADDEDWFPVGSPVVAADGHALWVQRGQTVVRVVGKGYTVYPWPNDSWGDRLLAGPEDGVWAVGSVGGWGSPDDEGHVGSATLLRPDATTERVTLPAAPEDIGWIVAGADGSLWVTVCPWGGIYGGCGSSPELMRYDGSWTSIPYPREEVVPVAVDPSGGLWAVLHEGSSVVSGILARYSDGAWRDFTEAGDWPDPSEPAFWWPGGSDSLAMAPDGSVCTISSSRAELVCVDQVGAVTRSPVPVVGRISIAADGSVWVSNEGALAQLPAAAPLDAPR